ncbi:MAG: PrkA family serine protein kinase [Planctomycetota bacterium]|jgi:predicted Ser/Thr protein kinase
MTREYDGLADRIQTRFRSQGRIRSFWEFLDEVREQPYKLLRSAPQYLRDMLDYFGTRTVQVFGEEVTRHKLFDGVPGDPEAQRLVGQELATDAIYRALRNFTGDGKARKLILMHGPNGSAKTTIADLLFKGLEHYSTTEDGALFRFSWVFPRAETEGSGLGFGGRGEEADVDSYAYLDVEEIASTVTSDLKSNPIYLIPTEEREALLADICGGTPDFPHEHALRGQLGTKSREIFEALLIAHNGDWRRVMRYVRVERFEISRRYRTAAITIEPQQANIDADARQVTADLNLVNLPPALQNLRLFEIHGDLVDANRGLLEYSDFLKRPLELNKYLLTTTEKATVRMPGALAYLDVVMIGSANEKHLDGFKADANFTSFMGRIDLVAAPYLLEYEKEVEIYRDEIASIGKRLTIAPHTARSAALWAVLTRLWRPDAHAYEEPLRSQVAKLTPLAKALLYQGRDPSDLEDLAPDEVKLLRANLAKIAGEFRDDIIFEGRFGASPREMKRILLDASYRSKTKCFTPMTVLEELRGLVKDKTVYDFLKLEPKGDYNNPERFVEDVERAVVRLVMRELKDSMALVEEEEYDRRFVEYFTHVIAHTRGKKVTDPRTGDERDPDPGVLRGVEELLDTGDDIETWRQDLIGKVGAHSVNNPGTKVNYRSLFPDILRRLKQDFYENRKGAIHEIEDDLLLVDTPAWESIDKESKAQVETTLANMQERYGYTRETALEMIGYCLRESRADARQAAADKPEAEDPGASGA